MKKKKSGLSVLIAGGTRGIGLEMAHEFLKKGHNVTICGRTGVSLEKALKYLSKYEAQFLGVRCDVTDIEQVECLWEAAVDRFGSVDIWINNAGISYLSRPVWEIAGGEVKRIINVNISGAIYGSQVAISGMLDQGYGEIYNMEGCGSNGHSMSNTNILGTTKAAIRYFTDGLIRETKGFGVLVGSLNPGMLVTDFLMKSFRQYQGRFARLKRIIHTIGDKPESAAHYLVSRILANRQHGVRFVRFNPVRLFFRFIAAQIVPWNTCNIVW